MALFGRVKISLTKEFLMLHWMLTNCTTFYLLLGCSPPPMKYKRFLPRLMRPCKNSHHNNKIFFSRLFWSAFMTNMDVDEHPRFLFKSWFWPLEYAIIKLVKKVPAWSCVIVYNLSFVDLLKRLHYKHSCHGMKIQYGTYGNVLYFVLWTLRRLHILTPDHTGVLLSHHLLGHLLWVIRRCHVCAELLWKHSYLLPVYGVFLYKTCEFSLTNPPSPTLAWFHRAPIVSPPSLWREF